MRTATLVSTRDIHGRRWTLWSLSGPLMGFSMSRSGRVEPHAIHYVLTVEHGRLCRALESNSSGELVGWGALPFSKALSPVESLSALGVLGFEVERQAV